LKRSSELEGGVLAVVELGRSRQESRGAARADIRFKNFLRIIEEAQDEIEAAEVIGQLGWELGVSREKPGERGRFHRTNCIRVKAFLGERGDGFGAENFEVRVREAIAQKFYRGQGEDEIADGATADDQDAIQVSSA